MLVLDGMVLPSEFVEPVEQLDWHILSGELRIRDLSCEELLSEPSEVDIFKDLPAPSVWINEMYAKHVAHFESFMEGSLVEPKALNVLESLDWGLLISGHSDGTMRLWLRTDQLLLLHVVSLRPLALPWQPLPSEPPALERYAGIDACPCFRAGEAQMALSAVALLPSALALLGGCSTGEVVAFLWRPSEELSPSEAAEWRAAGHMAFKWPS